jgi:hypothetical protein
VALYYFNHDESARAINEFFDGQCVTRTREVCDGHIADGDVVFVHPGPWRDDWIECATRRGAVRFIFMSREGVTRDANWPGNIEALGYPAGQLRGNRRVVRFIRQRRGEK